MKLSSWWLGAAATSALMFTGCVKDQCTQKITHWKDLPVYKTLAEIRVPITAQPARALKKPGKIYLYDTYVLINEVQEGVHVIDNSTPSNPQNIAFIPIPGNVDIAMKGNVLYADNFMDLVAIDLTNPASAQILKRVEGIFPTYGTNPDDAAQILVAYKTELVTEEIACDQLKNNPWGGGIGIEDGGFTTNGGTGAGTGGASGAGRVSGMGGSMSRFAISGDYLYAVDNSNMHVISIVTMENPFKVNSVGMTIGTETLFPYEDKLFVGSNTGMQIYDCSNPESPVFLSSFEHAFACDPVFVDGNFAYITLRDGSPCRTGNNQLDIVDISTITNPVLVQSHQVESPYGLSVRDNVLFLCQGDNGFKTFDVTNKNVLTAYGALTSKAYDVIAVPHTDLIMVVGDGGFFQYNAVNPSSLEMLSKIEVTP